MAIQYFTSVQAFAHQLLTHAIREALDSGETVPCQEDPTEWDDSASDPVICAGCPVLRQCARYADTGAVEHGVIAGRRIHGRTRRVAAAARERGVEGAQHRAVQQARRDAEYAFGVAVKPEFAKELRLLRLKDWTLGRFVGAHRRLFDYQDQETRLRERSIAAASVVAVAANLIVFWSLGQQAATDISPSR